MNTIQEILREYWDKWDKWADAHQFPENDERRYCWGWQFDETNNFITTPRLLLACYISGYQDDAIYNLYDHFIADQDTNKHYREMARGALLLYASITGRPPFEKERCPHCGGPVYPSSVNGYSFQCFNCDEDFYSIETK